MQLIADGLLIATALTAALYCLVLSRRLRRLTDAEAGIGTQIHALNKALEETRAGLQETRRGIAEARASAGNAREALAGEVAAARREAEALAEARRAAVGLLARLEEAGPASPPRRETPAPEPAAETPAPPEEFEPIPDWPDGVIDLPEDDAPEPRQAAAVPLRVERMAL